jgi:hypothetical protein
MPNYQVIVKQIAVLNNINAASVDDAKDVACNSYIWDESLNHQEDCGFHVHYDVNETCPLKQYDVCVVAEVTKTITVSALDEDSAEEKAHELFVLAEAEITEQKTYEIKGNIEHD